MSILEKAKAFWDRGRSFIGPDGTEYPDPRPMALPVGFERPESIQDLIRRLVTDPALRAEMQGSAIESFDEADDFEIEDDFPQSPHEDSFDPQHIVAREEEIRSGAVSPRTPQEIEAARAAIAKVRKVSPPKADGEPKSQASA